MDRLPPITPGELLQEEFLQPLGVSQYRLAKAIGVPASRISEIVTGQRAITADTDLRLCRFLGLSPGYWLRARLPTTPSWPVLNWQTSWSRSSPWWLLRRNARGIPLGDQSASPARRRRSDRRSAAGRCRSPDSPAPGPAVTPHRP